MIHKSADLTGGGDQNCLGLMSLLTERGHEVALLSTQSSENVVRTGVFVERRVTHQTRDRLSITSQIDVACRALWNPDSARAIKQLMIRFRPDVVHAHKLYPQISVAPIVIAARASAPIVQTLHDSELLSASAIDETGGWLDLDESRFRYRAINTATFPVRRAVHARRVSTFIAPSRFLAERYRAKRGLDAVVLPYFVEPYERTPRDFSERTGAVFVGRLVKEKGVFDVIRLAELLADIRVTVIGYGPLEWAVRDAASRLANLEFMGRMDRSSIRALLEHARVSLMPSHVKESGGIAALEAMSVGTPVVAYQSGGLGEYVADTGGGRALSPAVDALARETSILHEDERQWRVHSRQGLAGVARLHSPDRYVARIEEIYASVIARSPRQSTGR
jgi:glycosyltransferase involved in cell wall biosynthesis